VSQPKKDICNYYKEGISLLSAGCGAVYDPGFVYGRFHWVLFARSCCLRRALLYDI
jgi:hypothetical protein